MTRTAFLNALDKAMRGKGYDWSDKPHPKDPLKTRHEYFLLQTQHTMETDRNIVNIDSPSFVEAWRAIGGKGKPTYKGLRALPVE